MGEKDDFKNEIAELEKRLKQKKLSEEAHKKVKHEIKKLQMMAPMSAEATVVRNYIDWLLDMPWSEKQRTNTRSKSRRLFWKKTISALKKSRKEYSNISRFRLLSIKTKDPSFALLDLQASGKHPWRNP